MTATATATATAAPNGRPRKNLASQLDRLDGILDGLADGLHDAVSAAVTEAVTLAVRQALQGVLTELLTNPQVLEQLRRLLAPATPAPAPPGTPAPAAPKSSLRQRLAGACAWVGDCLRAACGLGGFVAALGAQAGLWLRRVVGAGAALASPAGRPRV
jgi:hypothetical protein